MIVLEYQGGATGGEGLNSRHDGEASAAGSPVTVREASAGWLEQIDAITQPRTAQARYRKAAEPAYRIIRGRWRNQPYNGWPNRNQAA